MVDSIAREELVLDARLSVVLETVGDVNATDVVVAKEDAGVVALLVSLVTEALVVVVW